MVYGCSATKGQTVARPLCDFSMSMVAIRPRRYPVRCTAVIVSVVELVHGFMVSICEYGRFAVVVVHIWSSRSRRLFLLV